jgi:hypothetical protein
MRALVLLNIHLLSWKVLYTLLVRELKLHITFLESITVPVVLRKGLPRIIGLEVLLLMSIIIKSIGTKVIWSSIITSFIISKACLVESSASNKSMSHFSSFL